MTIPGDPDVAGPDHPDAAVIVIAPAHPAIEHEERDIVFELRESADGAPVDIAAAGASTYFGAQDDMAAGVPAYVAYPGEAGGNVAAIAAGGWVGGLAAGGAAAGLGALGVSGVGLTLAAGRAGVLAGGVVAYGVGDFAHNLIQETGAGTSRSTVLSWASAMGSGTAP
jgi:hypothetical protein